MLVVEQGKKCSLHYHVAKDETFYVVEGEIYLEILYKDGKRKGFCLKEGDTFHVTPGLAHQFSGVKEKNAIFEFSTQHFEEDSYRIVRGD